MNPIGLEKKLSSSCADLFRATMMNNSRCHETDSRVPVFVIVVVEEAAAEQASILDGTETTRELGAILQRLELRLGVGIVVGDVRSRVGLRHAEVGQKQGDGLTPHRPATIRVESELAGFDALLATALDHKTASELGTFPVSQHPPRHVAGENVQLCGAPHNWTHVEHPVMWSRSPEAQASVGYRCLRLHITGVASQRLKPRED